MIRRFRMWRRRRKLDLVLAELDLPPGMHLIFSGNVTLTVEDYARPSKNDPERFARWLVDEFKDPKR